ncbi:MAG: hypothetical protein Fur0020_05830 [Thermodesulfovibrionia bacterium]
MNKVAVFIIRKSGFYGLEAESVQRIKRYLLKNELIDVFEVEDISGICKILCGNKSYKIIVLIYGDVYITSESILRLSRIMERHEAFPIIAPVSNEAFVPEQRCHPPYIYQTPTVFKWAVNEVYQRYGDEIMETEQIDNFCIAIKRDVFDSLQWDIQFNNIPNFLRDKGFRLHIAKGIYVHRYGNCYESDRNDILRLIPSNAVDILDIGCANGLFGEILKKRQRCVVTGVEMNADAVNIARGRLDIVIHGDIEEIIDKGILGNYDCIICGDVLEHLNNPWGVVAGLRRHLREKGFFIASTPNIANWSILYEMLHGRWDYVPFSILSGTHIRFFTKETLIELFEDNGYLIRDISFHGFEIPDKAMGFITSLKRLFPIVNEDELKASEILIVAQRT